jgi:hypothetical protein
VRVFELARIDGKDLVGDVADGVGEKNLAAEAEGEAPEAGEKAVEGVFAAGDLVGEVVEADDRAGDEVREKRDVEQVVAEVAGGWGLAAEDVDQVGDLLKREEGDADGQENLRPRDGAGAEPAEEDVELLDEEVAVLAVGQRADVVGEGECEQTVATLDGLGWQGSHREAEGVVGGTEASSRMANAGSPQA